MAETEKAHKVQIVGVGEDGLDGLTEAARRLVLAAEVLVGENHSLALVPDTGAERLVVGSNLDEAVAKIEASAGKRTVVLAVGDPLFYGVARFLSARLGKDRFEVVPHVSSMQLAFARVMESWEDAFLTNLATQDLEEVIGQIRTAQKVGLFTTDQWTPPAVARALLDAGLDYFTAYVCENLGSPDERVTQGELEEIASHEFAPLNVMILLRKPEVPDRPTEAIGRRLFGNPDEAFLQTRPKRGLLTHAEIRSIALAEMDLGPSSLVWDIGAGSGSVAIEAAQIAAGGTVYAVEMDPADHELIKENAERFGVRNLVPVLGRAPEAWEELPDPDAVFIGSRGRGIVRLVEEAYGRLKTGGRLVATMSSVDNVTDVHQLLRGYRCQLNILMLNVARGTFQFDRLFFEAFNPTFLVSVVKPGSR
ncbi:MAG TPA: precorrin-6y C5,15-methyltransferase (decarboxylating) subunit CbiE [Planctomycetaceae bacterium]|nr:precorrin-6y C5,15-methyltransferase (decarboxylating) subunit CbiE [Planctomycetaceae bacterium]